MKPTIKLKILDWWHIGGGDKEKIFRENFFVKFLSKKYELIQSQDPDYVLCSVFGNQHKQYNHCIKILFVGENVVPDFNSYDYAISFFPLEFRDRHLSYPLPFIYERTKLAESKHLLTSKEALLNRKFCSFVVSNNFAAHPIRGQFFDALNAKKPVASGGAYKNNVGGAVQDKQAFISSFKFNIAFENSSSMGYCTEKLIDAFAAKTVPIYWGDPLVKEWVNPKAMINLSDFKSIDEAIEYILYIDSRPDLYLEMLEEKAFLIDNIVEVYEKRLENFLDCIFSQPLTEAPRIMQDYQLMQSIKGGGDTQTHHRCHISSLFSLIQKVKRKFINLFFNPA